MTNKQIPRKFGITIALALLLTTSSILIGQTPQASALSHSTNVAYVTDFGTGLCDTTGPGSGSSVFVNAVNGTAPTGCPSGPITYTTGSNQFATIANGNTVTFTDVAVSTIDAGGVATLAPFDTVMLYEVCDIGSHPGLMAAVNSYLVTGGDHKVIILDGDRCSPISAGSANYTSFLFPFTSSNPGPLGETGNVTFVESESSPAVLTRAITTGVVNTTDAIGDSNTFTSNTGGWCAAQIGTNGEFPPITGIQTGYARTATGGLAIWNGWDTWFTFGANQPDAQIFDNILDQPFNPDSLPCGVPVTGIKLGPLTATNPVGTTHTVTATVSDSAGNPQTGITVTFTVTGVNTASGTAVTNSTGMAAFTYTGTNAGTDTIVATFTDSTGGIHTSGTVNKIWNIPSFTQGRMTGGGSVTDPSGTPTTKVTHGFNLKCDASKTPNSLEINWGNGNKFHLTNLTSASCTDDPSIVPNPPTAGFDTYTGQGTGNYNGVSGATATWTFTDAGEPGKKDHATIVIKDSGGNTVLSISGNLNSGNQQAHNQ